MIIMMQCSPATNTQVAGRHFGLRHETCESYHEPDTPPAGVQHNWSAYLGGRVVARVSRVTDEQGCDALRTELAALLRRRR